jgi:hypothetical protein
MSAGVYDSNLDFKVLKKEIETIKPTHILSLIGRTHGKIGNKVVSTIDYLENEGKLVENIRDNLYSPLILANICEKKNIHFTYLGTGCIFDYDDDHLDGFKEEDNPNFFGSSYSIVKGFTDCIMKQMNVLNLRIRMPINAENKYYDFEEIFFEKNCDIMSIINNFFMKYEEYIKGDKEFITYKIKKLIEEDRNYLNKIN